MLRTVLFFGLLTGTLLIIGFLLAGMVGMLFFLILSFVINFAIYWHSDKIVLGMYKAKEVSENEEPEIHEIVKKLAKEAKIHKPKIYLIKTNVPNAFACGRSPKKSVVALTSGLINALNKDEIEGVIAHEIAHIKARDTLTSVVAATIAGAISYIAYIAWWSVLSENSRRSVNILLLPLLIFAPMAATLVRLAISREREYKADENGAILSKKPLSLASALEKISLYIKRSPMEGNAATSHLFIVNPFRSDSFSNLFNTHPSVELRIKRLKELAEKIKS